MHDQFGILRSEDKIVVRDCQEVSRQIDVLLTVENEMSEFLLKLQSNNYHVALFDCFKADKESFKWVKIIRKLRPKLPLIVLCREVDDQIAAKMYEKKIFYLGLLPIPRDTLGEVMTSALKLEFN